MVKGQSHLQLHQGDIVLPQAIGDFKMTTTEQSMYSVKEVANILGVGASSVWRYAQNGVLPKPVKIGHSSRWRKADIEQFINLAA